MLKESKILTLVHKWAAQITDTAGTDAAGTTALATSSKTENGESSDGSTPTVEKEATMKDSTTVVSSSSVDVSASGALPSVDGGALPSAVVFEGIPHKKRFRILRLQSEEASSSDSDAFDLCKEKTEVEAEGAKRKDGSGVEEGNAESEHEAIGNEAVAAICSSAAADTMSESSHEALELGQGDASKVSSSCVTELASVLLTGWVELKVCGASFFVLMISYSSGLSRYLGSLV